MTLDTRRLAELLAPGAQDPSITDVRDAVAARLARHGCARPGPGADDHADMRHALWWLLRMAERTYARALAPLPDPPLPPSLHERFTALLDPRPGRDDAHAQLHIDAASTLRRAEKVRAHLSAHPGPVLAVGDDDALTLALALMGVPELFAVDIDERILSFLSSAARSIGAHIEVARVDVLDEPLPASLRRRCSAVLADPIRSLEPTLGFLLFGAAAMRRDAPSRLFWADHPDWTFEHAQIVETLAQGGLSVVATHEDLHAYPLEPGVIDLERVARELGLELEWLRELASLTKGWSSLYELARM